MRMLHQKPLTLVTACSQGQHMQTLDLWHACPVLLRCTLSQGRKAWRCMCTNTSVWDSVVGPKLCLAFTGNNSDVTTVQLHGR